MKIIRKINLYWNTIKYLKPIQIYGRIWFFLYKTSPDFRAPPNLSDSKSIWKMPPRRLESMVGPQTFILLNKSGELKEINWNGSQREKLWRYNQHYFYDLTAFDAMKRQEWHKELINNWIASNPPGYGVGWDVYPLSIRVINWIKWSLSGNSLSTIALSSLAVQVRWLNSKVEYHLLGNHLFINAKALIFAGLFFSGNEANIWLKKGLDILIREIDEQILPDGGHFERSVMYHMLAFEDILDLMNILNTFSENPDVNYNQLNRCLQKKAKVMYEWMIAMCHPDGELSFFNDSAFDVSPTVSELKKYAEKFIPCNSLHENITSKLESGYIRLEHGNAVSILDVAPVGPDYLPAHSHADSLSFELSVFGHRVLVNSGTSCYGSSNERVRQRGTAAHNTVIINGKNSSEVWLGFRVARRAYPFDLQIKEGDDECYTVSCAHNGYSYLSGKPIHHRTWYTSKKGLKVCDRIDGPYSSATARFHLHPALNIYSEDLKSGSIYLPNNKVIIWNVVNGNAKIEQATWHPRFGESIPNKCLIVDLLNAESEIHFTW